MPRVERTRTFHVERGLTRALTLASRLAAHIRRARAEGVAERARIAAERRKALASYAARQAKEAERARIAHICLHTSLLITTGTTARKPERSWN